MSPVTFIVTSIFRPNQNSDILCYKIIDMKIQDMVLQFIQRVFHSRRKNYPNDYGSSSLKEWYSDWRSGFSKESILVIFIHS